MAGFDVIDYVILVLIILASLGIGIFYGRKKQDTKEYTTGSGHMGILPVGLSLNVSFVSAITIQGVPAEIYLYGVEYMLNVIGMWGCLLAIVTFIPLYCRLDIDSVYDILYMGIATFGPAAALESVTGVVTWVWILVMVGICTVYTSLGGIKAVICTDVCQAAVMFLGLIAIITVGLVELKDVNIMNELRERSRLKIHLSPDPTLRLNVWILTLADGIAWIAAFSMQPALTRVKSVGTERRAQWMMLMSTVGFVLLQLLAYAAGIVMFAYYSSKGCGPLANEEIYSPNQVISHYVVEALDFPGVPGLFIAALVGATLSTISTGQSAISAIVWYDLLSHRMQDAGEWKKTLVIKITVVVCGSVSIAVAFASQYIGGSLVQISNTILGAFGGPISAMFLVGATLPFVGAWAVTVASVMSALLVCALSVGSLVYGASWEEPLVIDDTCGTSNTSTYGHNANVTAYPFTNGTATASTDSVSDFWETIFSISPFLYSTIGILLCYTFSLVLTIIPALRQKNTESQLLFPFVVRIFCLKSNKTSYDLQSAKLYLSDDRNITQQSHRKPVTSELNGDHVPQLSSLEPTITTE